MTINKRKKNSRQRGSHTHGGGSKKKCRGAGHRGGRGMSGTGKRGDAKKPCIWGDVNYFGKIGFIKKNANRIIAVNLMVIEKNLEKLLSKKLIEKKGNVYIIDAQKLGFDKVLGCGKITKKMTITAYSFSQEAIEKIKAAGGEAIEANAAEDSASEKEVG